MNFRHVEVFFAVMTSGTVTAAARLLGVSQPSVTTTIQQAESRLGLRLFQREGGRLIPTAEARTLFEEAERAHEALDAFRTLAQRLKEGQGGHLRIAAVPSISLELLPDAIARFQRVHGSYNYSVSALNTEEMLQQLDSRSGTFQLGFSFGYFHDSGFSTQVVGEVELFAVVPASWKVEAGSELSLSDLVDRPYVSGFDSTPVGQICRALFKEAGVEPSVAAWIHTHHMAGRLVQHEMGYALLDSVTVRALLHERDTEGVTVCRIEGKPAVPVSAIFRAQRSPGKSTRLFVECFEEAFAKLENTVEDRLPRPIQT